jgi:hypothetical protein
MPVYFVTHGMQYSVMIFDIHSLIDQITIKTTNPKCRRLYWCLFKLEKGGGGVRGLGYVESIRRSNHRDRYLE